MLELIAISFVTLVVTALGSYLSAAFGGISHHILTNLTNAGNAEAATLLEFKRDSDPPRAALFLIDTFISTLGCVAIGAYAIITFTSLEASGISLLVTVILLVFGRMLPRALGRRFAVRSVGFTVASLRFVMLGMKPLVVVVDKFFRAFAPPTRDDEEIVREELDEIIETARDDGSLDTNEYNRLKNVVRFSDVRISDVMTPRTVVFSSPCSITIREAVQLPELRHYSRFPLFEEDSLDSIVGYVLTKDILWEMIQGNGDKKLRELSRDVYFIPENIDLDRALENFLERREHLFVVVDEYGGVDGLITMEDVVETLLGVEILDEMDKVSNLRALAVQRRDQRIATLRAQNAHVDDSATDVPHASIEPEAGTDDRSLIDNSIDNSIDRLLETNESELPVSKIIPSLGETE
jgi:CBS domain containing-hemolysin-like protein